MTVLTLGDKKSIYARHVLDTCEISLPFLSSIGSKKREIFRRASIRQAIDLSVANEQKYIYLFFRQSIRINIELIIESCINCLPSGQNLSAYHA